MVVPIGIRRCRTDDLNGLEWLGAFSEHRDIIQRTFAAQRRGEGAMLIAESQAYPAGQIWVDLRKKRRQSVGILWALRVWPGFQRLGIGRRLIRAAESVVAEAGLLAAELGVDQGREPVRALYERLGYAYVGDEIDRYDYRAPGGDVVHVEHHLWLLRRRLPDRSLGRAVVAEA